MRQVRAEQDGVVNQTRTALQATTEAKQAALGRARLIGLSLLLLSALISLSVLGFALYLLHSRL